MYEWKKNNNNKVVNKAIFGRLLAAVFRDKATPDVIKNGFRKCGIYPFDPNAVDYARCMSSENRKCPPAVMTEESVKPAEFKIEHILLFESLMKAGRAEQFREAEKTGWEGPLEAKELFDVWKKIRNKCIVTEQRSDRIIATEVTSEVAEHINSTAPITSPGSNSELQNNDFEQEPCSSVTLTPVKSRTPEVKNTHQVLQVKKSRISPSFGNHVTWPTDSPPAKGGRKKERLPHATTSKKWLDWVQQKEEIKAVKENTKKRKLQAKESAKKDPERDAQAVPEKIKRRTRKEKRRIEETDSETSEEWVESGDSLDDVTLLPSSEEEGNEKEEGINEDRGVWKEGDFVLVNFPGKKNISYNYVCFIQKVLNDEIQVIALKNCDESCMVFRTDEDDVSVVVISQILKKLDDPNITGTEGRIRYQFLHSISVGRQN